MKLNWYCSACCVFLILSSEVELTRNSKSLVTILNYYLLIDSVSSVFCVRQMCASHVYQAWRALVRTHICHDQFWSMDVRWTATPIVFARSINYMDCLVKKDSERCLMLGERSCFSSVKLDHARDILLIFYAYNDSQCTDNNINVTFKRS